MKKRLHNNISESQVESALVSDLHFLNKILDAKHELKLLARQLRLQGGKQIIDIIVLDGEVITILELKVTKFSEEHLLQIVGYRNELKKLQSNKEFIEGGIRAVILVPKLGKKENTVEITKNNVEVIEYSPLEVMSNYFSKLATNAVFLNVKPNEYGVMNIGKISPTLYQLYRGIDDKTKISEELNLSRGSIHNHLRIAREFGLVKELNKKYVLSDVGSDFVNESNFEEALNEKLSDAQIHLLKSVISKDPFYSSTVFGIYAIVESTLILSRNSYPVELNDLQDFFKVFGGKSNQWNSKRTIQTVTYTFINFATDLELLGKIGKQIVITPSGFRFILMLQLHKSIEMIDNLK